MTRRSRPVVILACWLILSRGMDSPLLSAQTAEEKAVQAIKKLRGKVVRDDSVAGKPVVEVYLIGRSLSNADLAVLKPLKHLRLLDLGGSEVTDEGLAGLKDCKALKELYLNRTKVTDAGVADL